MAEALAFAEAGPAEGPPVAIATSARPEAVARLQRHLGRRRAARLAESILAHIATGLYAQGVRRFVSGGKTSSAVLEALKIEATGGGDGLKAAVASGIVPGRSGCPRFKKDS